MSATPMQYDEDGEEVTPPPPKPKYQYYPNPDEYYEQQHDYAYYEEPIWD